MKKVADPFSRQLLELWSTKNGVMNILPENQSYSTQPKMVPLDGKSTREFISEHYTIAGLVLKKLIHFKAWLHSFFDFFYLDRGGYEKHFGTSIGQIGPVNLSQFDF